MFRQGDLKVLAMIAGVALALLAFALALKLRDLAMKTMIALAGVAVLLSGCQTFTLEDYAKAANDLDPKCGKKVHLEVTPIIMGFWVIPVIGGSYDKSCNPDQFAAPARPPLVAGQVIGGPVTP